MVQMPRAKRCKPASRRQKLWLHGSGVKIRFAPSARSTCFTEGFKNLACRAAAFHNGFMREDSNHYAEKQATGVREPSDADLDMPIKGFKGTPEEIERQWFEKIYTGRGDRQKQLTLRAVLMGGVLGMFMSISNLYTTLKLGWSFGVAITACVLSYVIWNAIRALSGGKLNEMTILENNCMQSTASAAGYSTGGT